MAGLIKWWSLIEANMSELKFNKVPGIDYWLSDEIDGNYKYRICTNSAGYYRLDALFGTGYIGYGEYKSFQEAETKAATLEAIDDPDNRQWPDYGFILQLVGMAALIVLGIICIYKFGN